MSKIARNFGELRMEVRSVSKEDNVVLLKIDFVNEDYERCFYQQGEYLVDVYLDDVGNLGKNNIKKKYDRWDIDEHGEVIKYTSDGDITLREVYLIGDIVHEVMLNRLDSEHAVQKEKNMFKISTYYCTDFERFEIALISNNKIVQLNDDQVIIVLSELKEVEALEADFNQRGAIALLETFINSNTPEEEEFDTDILHDMDPEEYDEYSSYNQEERIEVVFSEDDLPF